MLDACDYAYDVLARSSVSNPLVGEKAKRGERQSCNHPLAQAAQGHLRWLKKPVQTQSSSDRSYSVIRELELPAVLFTKQLAYKRLVHSIFEKTADCFDLLKFVILDV